VNGLGDSGSPCGSGSGGGGGVVTYSGPTLSILSGTSFCPIGGGGACSATEANVDIDSSATATVSRLYVQLSTALGVGNSVAVTWRANGSSQTITCTISGAVATSCNDTTHSFTATSGDLLSYQLVFSGTILVTPTITIMSAFGTSNVGVTSVSGTAPVTSTGGTTPVIACATCITGTPTNHGVALGSTTQAANYSSAGTAGQFFGSNGAGADGSYQAVPGTIIGFASWTGTGSAVVAVSSGIVSGVTRTGTGVYSVALSSSINPNAHMISTNSDQFASRLGTGFGSTSTIVFVSESSSANSDCGFCWIAIF